jgi:hypothetical protein
MAGSAAKPSEENARSTYTRRLFWLLPTLLLVVFLGDRILNGNNAEVHHQRLEQEFRGVPAPPNSKLIANLDFFSVWNSHKASVGAAYASPQSHSEIRSFYDRELESLGWRLLDKTSSTQTTYCKGEFSAHLRYGENLPTGADYVLSLDWGFVGCR